MNIVYLPIESNSPSLGNIMSIQRELWPLFLWHVILSITYVP